MLESKKEEQKWRVITHISKDLNLPFMLVKTCKTFFLEKYRFNRRSGNNTNNRGLF